MGDSESAVIRSAVRLLFLDENERVLLFRSVNPDTGVTFWFPPGGGIEPGETVVEAARREAWEELGTTDLELGPEIWHRRHVFSWRGETFDQRERWFLVRMDSFTPDRDENSATELADLLEWRWWNVDELAATDDQLVPLDFASLVSTLLRDGPPPEPFAIGV